MARNTRKFRFIMFEVYPDNKPQMDFFNWFISAKNTLITGGMYIKHKAETGEKDHIHCMFYRDIPLTGKYTENSGSAWFQCDTVCTWSGVYEWYRDEQTRQNYYKGYDDNGLPDDVQWITKQTVEHVEGVSDPVAMASYFLHSRYCDREKIRYHFEDLCFFGEDRRLRQLFDCEDSLNTDLSFELFQIAHNNDICRGEGQRLIEICIQMSRVDLLDYIRKNHAFVEFYLLNPRRG